MLCDDSITVQLPSGFNVTMSTELHDNLYSCFSESQLFSFYNLINAGSYFPQIMQFIAVLVAITRGYAGWIEIILCSVICGAVFTALWFLLRLYKIPGLNFISCLIGGNIFRLFLHFIPIAIIAFFVVQDWTVLLFCVIGGIIASIVRTVLFNRFSNVKYCNEAVAYISSFTYK